MAVGGGVVAGEVVLELAFDVAEEGGGAEAEEVGLQPGMAEFVFHERVEVHLVITHRAQHCLYSSPTWRFPSSA